MATCRAHGAHKHGTCLDAPADKIALAGMVVVQAVGHAGTRKLVLQVGCSRLNHPGLTRG